MALLLPESLPLQARRAQPIGVVLSTYGGCCATASFMGWVLSGGLIFSGLLAYISGSSFVFIELFDVPPERFGLFFGANAIGLIAASQINGWLARRFHPKQVVNAVMPIAAVAGLVLVLDVSTRIRRLRRHPRAALLLRRVPRLRDAEHDGAGDGAARRRGRQRLGAPGHRAVHDGRDCRRAGRRCWPTAPPSRSAPSSPAAASAALVVQTGG